MKGIELSRQYYEECGRPVFEQQFGDVLPYLAFGIVGSGSDRFGYDDEISQDHDFEPGFCVFLPDEKTVDRHTEFLLSRAYDKLPREFKGFKRQRLSPVGGRRNGVIRTAEFYESKIGSGTGELSLTDWLMIPDSFLSEATNGEVFCDRYGEFSRIRDSIMVMPEDVRRKRLAGVLLVMAQSGQYNYKRCLSHGEFEAAQLAVNAFADAAARSFFLLNKRYMPFYKWVFRAMREIPGGDIFADKLVSLLSGDIYDPYIINVKNNVIEEIAKYTVSAIIARKYTKESGADLERHAYSVNDGIVDGELRNMNIMSAV